MKGGLRPFIYARLNPVGETKEAAEIAEKSLAQQLRDQGLAVHSA